MTKERAIEKADQLIDQNKQAAIRRFKRLCAQLRSEAKLLGLRPISQRYEKYAVNKIEGL